MAHSQWQAAADDMVSRLAWPHSVLGTAHQNYQSARTTNVGMWRARLIEAVYQGTQDLKQEIREGKPTEEPIRPGIEEKLDEILALLSRFRQ